MHSGLRPLAIACTGAAGFLFIAVAGPACGDIVLSDAPTADAATGDDGGGANVDAGAESGAQQGPHEPVTCDPGLPYPKFLGCTGLYANWVQGTITPTAKEFTPGFQLWSDGAEKTRWIQLPPGTKIDVSDMNEWKFPLDTKLWKEFRLVIGGKAHKVETRMLWKVADEQWIRATYRWNDLETNAAEVTDGVQSVLGTRYEIPSQSQCTTCHKGRKDSVLGFEAVLLAADGAKGLTYAELLAQGLLSSNATPAPNLKIPGNPSELAAFGYVHANCGVACHSGASAADAAQCRMKLRLDVDGTTGKLPATALETSIVKNTVNIGLANFAPPDGTLAAGCRIFPRKPAESALHFRASRRDQGAGTNQQMPTVGTNVVDEKGMAAISAWIEGMTPDAGYPAPIEADAGCPRP